MELASTADLYASRCNSCSSSAGKLYQELQRSIAWRKQLALKVLVSAMQGSQRQDAGWLAPISNALEYALSSMQAGLDHLHVPYSYGWSIILLTLFTKVLTFPFTKIQVCS